ASTRRRKLERTGTVARKGAASSWPGSAGWPAPGSVLLRAHDPSVQRPATLRILHRARGTDRDEPAGLHQTSSCDRLRISATRREAHTRTRTTRDSRANDASSVTLANVVTYGRAALMPRAVGSYPGVSRRGFSQTMPADRRCNSRIAPRSV